LACNFLYAEGNLDALGFYGSGLFGAILWNATAQGMMESFESLPSLVATFRVCCGCDCVYSSVIVEGTYGGIITTTNVHAVDTVTLVFQGFDFELPGVDYCCRGGYNDLHNMTIRPGFYRAEISFRLQVKFTGLRLADLVCELTMWK